MSQLDFLGDPRVFKKAMNHLRKADPKLYRVISKHGVINFNPQGEPFESLAESIMSQQLGSKAASAIIERTRAACGGSLNAKALSKLDLRKLRKAGLSRNKAHYLKGLASTFLSGSLDLKSLKEKSDQELINLLDPLKGIGPWTVQMFLIFTLGRSDVLPVDDFGIKKAIQSVYSLKDVPDRETIERIGKSWHPYCSVASLYLWKHKDTTPALKSKI